MPNPPRPLESNPNIRLAVGARVPNDAIGIAYYEIPALTSQTAVQLTDYSYRIDGNVEEENYGLKLYWADVLGSDRGKLTSPEGSTFLRPDILVTKIFHPDTDEPMFFRYTARRYLYDPGAQVDSHGWYRTQKVRVLRGEIPVTDGWLAKIRPTTKPGVYLLDIYFTGVPEPGLKVNYMGCNADGSLRREQRETINPAPIYQMTDKSEVDQADEDAEIYAVELSDDGLSFVVYVPTPKNEQTIPRGERIIRWRYTLQGKTTPWISAGIDSVIDESELLHGYYARLNDEYVRILSYDVLSEFGWTKSQFQNAVLTVEEWNGSSWDVLGSDLIVEAKTVNAITGEASSSRAKAGRLYPPGTAWGTPLPDGITMGDPISPEDLNPDTVLLYVRKNPPIMLDPNPNQNTIRVKETVCKLKIRTEGEMIDPPPLVITHNAASKDEGARITASGNADYINKGALDDIIDGIDSTVYDSEVSSTTRHRQILFFTFTDGQQPSRAPVTYEITFDQTRPIDRVEVELGQEGILEEVALVSSTGSVTTVMTESNASNYMQAVKRPGGLVGRLYSRKLDPPVSAAKMRFRVRPEIKLVQRSVTYVVLKLLFVKIKIKTGEKKTYRGALEVNSAGAYWTEVQTFDAGRWGKEATYSISSGHGNVPIKEIIKRCGLEPPEDAELDTTEITITPISQPPGASLGISTRTRWEPFTYWQKVPLSQIEDKYLFAPSSDYEMIVETAGRWATMLGSSDRIYPKLPYPASSRRPWFPRVHAGHISQVKASDGTLVDYAVPEFSLQPFDPVAGFPYRQVEGEVPEYIDSHHVRLSRTPLHVTYEQGTGAPTNITLKRGNQVLTIRDWNMFTGEIEVEEALSFDDDLEATYLYAESDLVYTGYYDEETGRFYRLDLNPSPGHFYDDPNGESNLPTSTLADKSVYLYILPIISNAQAEALRPLLLASGRTPEEILSAEYRQNDYRHLVRHWIAPRDASLIQVEEAIRAKYPGAQILGRYEVKYPYDPSRVQLIDTRRRGGGVVPFPGADRESLWDLSSMDGKPYPGQGVIVLEVPETVSESQRAALRDELLKFVAFGVYPVIRPRES